MSNSKFVKHAEFAFAVEDAALLPETGGVELAVVGRSNVGKSSFINRLVGQHSLARTSRTPGQTQQLNLFRVKLSPRENFPDEVFLADLPGYGYAKISKSKRPMLESLTIDYISNRAGLKVVCLLIDCRRDVEAPESYIQALAFESNRRFLPVLTKIDKLNSSELKTRRKVIAKGFQLSDTDLAVSGKDEDLAAFWKRAIELALVHSN